MADFKFFLNRQGVRGNKGEQGEQGYSPRITVKTETAAEYILNVQNEDGSFDTPNLRGNAIENLGGTYVRFDQDTEQMYTGYADTASTTSQGEVVLSTYEDLASGGDESEVTTSKDVHDFVEAKISEASVNYVDIDDYTQKMGELDSEISDLDENKLDFTGLTNTLAAGTNITITPNVQTGKITIAGEPLTQVQADWNQDNTDAPDYIKNKPTIPEAITVDDDFSTTSTNPVENRLITNAINLISNELEDFAEKDLSNLSADGEARLHALKAYSDNGEVLTDEKGLSDVTNYAHSTFDRSKFTTGGNPFTVIGTPTITNDGMYSASENNWIRLNVGSLPSIWGVKFKVTTPTLPTTQQNTALFVRRAGNANAKIVIRIDNNQQRMVLGHYKSDGTYKNDILNLTANTDYYFGIYVNGSNMVIKVNGESFITATDLNTSENIDYIAFATQGGGTNFWTTPFDLKHLEVNIDGTIYSGNKTGIDTIKPDDYTVVGTPTISSDGVVSGFSTSNYLTSSINITNQIDIVIKGSWVHTNSTDRQWLIAIYNSSATNECIQILPNESGNVIQARICIGANTFGSINLTDEQVPKIIGKKYNFELTIKGTNATFTVNGVSNSRNDFYAFTSTNFNIGASINGSYPFKGLTDLNDLQVYINGNLVYQPCLKIPYTESKTGSKVVNAIYRDRVNDMAEQFGYAPYYTLQEDNGNFTLPQVELYGLIEKAASTVPSGVVQSSTINNIVSLTQAEYDALATKDSNTFYIITPST